MHTTEYYPTLKWNEVEIRATTWMNLDDIMLNEICHTLNDTHCIISFICIYSQIQRGKSRIVVTMGLGWDK